MTADIRTTAGRLATVRPRKTKAAFGRRLERDAAALGVTTDELLAAVRDIAARRQAQRRREANRWEARLAAEQQLLTDWGEARKQLLAAGWLLTHESESGSEYYERDGQTLRLADHDIPTSASRGMAAADRGYLPRYDYEIIVGTRGWYEAVRELAAVVSIIRP